MLREGESEREGEGKEGRKEEGKKKKRTGKQTEYGEYPLFFMCFEVKERGRARVLRVVRRGGEAEKRNQPFVLGKRNTRAHAYTRRERERDREKEKKRGGETDADALTTVPLLLFLVPLLPGGLPL